MTFRVQPAVITRICDGCRTESDPVDCPELLDQGWTLAPGTPYDHPVTALDWCPNCTTIRSDLAAAIQRVRELHGRHDPNCPYGEDCAGAGLCLACREEYPCATICALDGLERRIDD